MKSDMTQQEQTNVRSALRFLRNQCGTWAMLGRALKFHGLSLSNAACGHLAVSPTLAFRVARFAQVGVDDVLMGRFPVPGTCPYCGRRPEEASDP